MQVFLIILSVILLGVIINYAFSVKSSRIVKLTALGALVLIALSLGAATIVIVVNNFKQVNEEEHLPIFLEAQREAANTRGNIVEIIISLGFLAFIIVLIAVVYSRDRKKMLEEAKKAGSKRFQSAAATSDMDQEAEEAPAKAKDGEFDLDL